MDDKVKNEKKETPVNKQSVKEQNIKLITQALQEEIIKDFAERTELYDKKFIEIFDNLASTQELLLLYIEENKKASLTLSQLEIDARISKALEDFEFTNKQLEKRNKESNQSSWLPYIGVAVLFLVIGYFIKL